MSSEDEQEDLSAFLGSERVKLTVDTGVCRFPAKVECWTEGMKMRCSITSNCKHVQDFGAELEAIDMMDIVTMPFSENKVYQVGGRTLKHSTCPMPMAVLKGFEAAAQLALKRDVTVIFEKL